MKDDTTMPKLPEDIGLPEQNKCPKCGIDLLPVMGYVCQDPQCPTGLGPRFM